MKIIKNYYKNTKPTIIVGAAIAVILSFFTRNFSWKSNLIMFLIILIPTILMFCYGIITNRIIPKINKNKD